MEVLIKLIVAAINFVCYTVTILYPCDVTVFSLLPSIITTSAWILESGKKVGVNKWTILLLSLSAFVGAACIFLGFTCTVGAVAQGSSEYFFEFRSLVAGIGGKRFSYNIFAVPTIALFWVLTLPELVLLGHENRKRSTPRSFDHMVDRAISNAR